MLMPMSFSHQLTPSTYYFPCSMAVPCFISQVLLGTPAPSSRHNSDPAGSHYKSPALSTTGASHHSGEGGHHSVHDSPDRHDSVRGRERRASLREVSEERQRSRRASMKRGGGAGTPPLTVAVDDASLTGPISGRRPSGGGWLTPQSSRKQCVFPAAGVSRLLTRRMSAGALATHLYTATSPMPTLSGTSTPISAIPRAAGEEIPSPPRAGRRFSLPGDSPRSPARSLASTTVWSTTPTTGDCTPRSSLSSAGVFQSNPAAGGTLLALQQALGDDEAKGVEGVEVGGVRGQTGESADLATYYIARTEEERAHRSLLEQTQVGGGRAGEVLEVRSVRMHSSVRSSVSPARVRGSVSPGSGRSPSNVWRHKNTQSSPNLGPARVPVSAAELFSLSLEDMGIPEAERLRRSSAELCGVDFTLVDDPSEDLSTSTRRTSDDAPVLLGGDDDGGDDNDDNDDDDDDGSSTTSSVTSSGASGDGEGQTRRDGTHVSYDDAGGVDSGRGVPTRLTAASINSHRLSQRMVGGGKYRTHRKHRRTSRTSLSSLNSLRSQSSVRSVDANASSSPGGFPLGFSPGGNGFMRRRVSAGSMQRQHSFEGPGSTASNGSGKYSFNSNTLGSTLIASATNPLGGGDGAGSALGSGGIGMNNNNSMMSLSASANCLNRGEIDVLRRLVTRHGGQGEHGEQGVEGNHGESSSSSRVARKETRGDSVAGDLALLNAVLQCTVIPASATGTRPDHQHRRDVNHIGPKNMPNLARVIAAMLRAAVAEGVDVSGAGGIAIAVDDAHWLDPMSALLLQEMKRVMPHLVIIASCRSGLARPSVLRGDAAKDDASKDGDKAGGGTGGKDAPRTPGGDGAGSLRVEMISLQGLSRAAIGLVLCCRRNVAVMDESVLEFIFRRARGVPGQCIDMLEHMLDLGIVAVDPVSGALRRVRLLDEVDLVVSDSSKADVLRAFERLPHHEKVILELASIVGNDVSLPNGLFIWRSEQRLEQR